LRNAPEFEPELKGRRVSVPPYFCSRARARSRRSASDVDTSAFRSIDCAGRPSILSRIALNALASPFLALEIMPAMINSKSLPPDFRSCLNSDRKIVSQCREPARRVYYRAVVEVKKEIPDYKEKKWHSTMSIGIFL
jgi:hypothetical protein